MRVVVFLVLMNKISSWPDFPPRIRSLSLCHFSNLRYSTGSVWPYYAHCSSKGNAKQKTTWWYHKTHRFNNSSVYWRWNNLSAAIGFRGWAGWGGRVNVCSWKWCAKKGVASHRIPQKKTHELHSTDYVELQGVLKKTLKSDLMTLCSFSVETTHKDHVCLWHCVCVCFCINGKPALNDRRCFFFSFCNLKVFLLHIPIKSKFWLTFLFCCFALKKLVCDCVRIFSAW